MVDAERMPGRGSFSGTLKTCDWDEVVWVARRLLEVGYPEAIFPDQDGYCGELTDRESERRKPGRGHRHSPSGGGKRSRSITAPGERALLSGRCICRPGRSRWTQQEWSR